MKFLVVGCNGMAGHLVSLHLKEQGHDVMGFARQKSRYVKTIIGDIKNKEVLKKIISDEEFDAIINCVGILNQAAERDKAESSYINACFPHYLASITRDIHTKIVQMSTDCVFSGERGNYTEKDFPDGKSFYDRTKALGELNDNKNITVRCSIIGPDINQNGVGLLNWFMAQKQTINGYTRSIWTGQTTLQLAKTIETVVVKKLTGIINAVPRTSISKYDLLRLLNLYFRDSSINIVPICGVVADKSLTCTREDFHDEVPDYETMISELSTWVYAHRDMYPHYFNNR